MGKNKNKQKEIVNDLDIKKEENMEVKNTENLTDIFIEKDNKIKELEEEIKRLKSLEILEEKLKEKENALNLRESEIKKLEDDLKNRKRVLDSENERVNFLEKSINNDSERLSKKASELNTQETELKEREIKIKEKENELEEELRKEKTRFELEEKNKVRGELSIYYEDSKKLVEERLDKEINKRRKEELKEIETEKGKKLSYGVISFYKAQVDEITERLKREGLADKVKVGSVDAFQGMEFDIMFLSVVRTNTKESLKSTFPYGFLASENRLCVALSRQKRLLIVVGDSDIFYSKEWKELAKKNVPAMVNLYELCLKKGEVIDGSK